jgi:hypothetical protein
MVGTDRRTCYAFDKTTRARVLTIVLVTVDDLVNKNPADFVCAPVRTVHDVLAGKVDFLRRFRASRVGYAFHRPKDK